LFPRGMAGLVTYGYRCEDCDVEVWPATTRSELQWLRDRQHVAREVARHSSSGLDTWMREGLEFLDRHSGHEITIVQRRS